MRSNVYSSAQCFGNLYITRQSAGAMISILLRAERFLETLVNEEAVDTELPTSIEVSYDCDYFGKDELEKLSGSQVQKTNKIPATLTYRLNNSAKICEIISLRFENNKTLPLKNELTNEKKMEWFTCIVNAALRPRLQYFSSDLFRVSPSRDAAAFSVEFNPE